MGMTEDQIIDYTARVEGGRSGPDAPYGTWNPDDNGTGVAFGFIQFNQAGGRRANSPGSPLTLMFAECKKAAPDRWAAIMGPYADSLTDPAWVKRADLNYPDIKSRLVAAAREPVFQRAQRDAARTSYFIPAKKIADAVGVRSARGLAMLFDASVQAGPPRTKKILQDAAKELGDADERSLLALFAQRMDDFASRTTGRLSTRRTAMLNDPNLPDDPPEIGLKTTVEAALSRDVPSGVPESAWGLLSARLLDPASVQDAMSETSLDDQSDDDVGISPGKLFLAGAGVVGAGALACYALYRAIVRASRP